MNSSISIGLPVQGNPGDTFTFIPPSPTTQYHFSVETVGEPAIVIGIWKGAKIPGRTGVARNAAGKAYVDHVCGLGSFVITVEGVSSGYTIAVTANSWFRRVFGWG